MRDEVSIACGVIFFFFLVGLSGSRERVVEKQAKG